MKSLIRHCYHQGWRFPTLWEGFGVEEATRSKNKCFSNALRHTLVVLEVRQAHRHFYLSIGPTKSGDNTF